MQPVHAGAWWQWGRPIAMEVQELHDGRGRAVGDPEGESSGTASAGMLSMCAALRSRMITCGDGGSTPALRILVSLGAKS